MGLPLLTFYGLGTILGAGIYALVGKVAGEAGLLSPAAFLLAAVLASFTALTYAELSTRFPLSAGEAVYVQQAFGRRLLSLVVGLVVVLTGLVSAAAVARSFVGYLGVFVELPAWLTIVALLAALGALAAWGIAESLKAALAFTLVEIAGLLLVVWVARGALGDLPARAGAMVPGLDLGEWRSMGLAAYLAFFAFIGFEDMANVAEEVKEPERTLPWAFPLALGVATLLYLVVSAAAVLAVPAEALAAADAPLARVWESQTGSSPAAISLIALFAVTNGALVQLVMASRVLYGLAAQGWLPRRLARVHPTTRTPLLATATVTGVALLLALTFRLEGLAAATTTIVLVLYAALNAALLRLKRRDPAPPRAFVLPAWVPATGLLVCLAFLAFRAGSWGVG